MCEERPYIKLTGSSGNKQLDEVIEVIVDSVNLLEKHLSKIEKDVKRIESTVYNLLPSSSSSGE